MQILSLGAALAVVATIVPTAAATAQTPPQGYYVAVPETRPTDTHLVTRTAAWRLQGDAYVANRAPERPEILCELVAGKAGPLSSFTVKGQPLAADKLAKCNAKVARSDAQMARQPK